MRWERASEDIYIFTSDRYAQVTASLIVSGATGVLIDTLPFPSETAQIALFARRRCPGGVRLVIYTGHEADHVYGAFFFPKAEIIAHELCRDILIERGFAALQRAKQQSQEFLPVQLRLPTITFSQGTFTVRMPGKTLEIIHTPGHTPDSISVLLHEERILFAGDTVMAIPTITDGDPEQLKASLEMIAGMQLENIVQGHGEMVLRGEIKENMRRAMNYLDNLRNKVAKVVASGGDRAAARAITIESCGMQRVLLNGIVIQLHMANVFALYDRMQAAATAALTTETAKPQPTSRTTTRKMAVKSTVKTVAKKAIRKPRPATKTRASAVKARPASKPKARAVAKTAKAVKATKSKPVSKSRKTVKTRPLKKAAKRAAKSVTKRAAKKTSKKSATKGR